MCIRDRLIGAIPSEDFSEVAGLTYLSEQGIKMCIRDRLNITHSLRQEMIEIFSGSNVY